MLAAASQHNVWVLTDKRLPRFVGPSRAARNRDESQMEAIDVGVDAERINLFTVPGFHFYYGTISPTVPVRTAS
jgi:hypothetical protein